MKIINILILVTLLYFVFAFKRGDKAKDKLRSITLISHFKDTYSNDSVGLETDSFKVIYFKDYTIYENPSIEYEFIKRGKVNDTLISELVPKDTSSNFYIIQNGSKQGLKFESKNLKECTTFSLDSFLVERAIDPGNLNLFDLELNRPIATKKNRNQITETFTPPKLDAEYSDTIYRYFDKNLKWVKFSYSKRLDAEKNSKLIRTHFVTLYSDDPSKPAVKIRNDIIYEIKETHLNYSDKLMQLIEQFEKKKEKKEI
ncbi:hypothetical protein ASU31_02470 [Pedobacter ginsenosidimutans]|uniref:Uncharacterized protein n=1 Tax=Pedobacter ginsenosidimutans TaxID=687842 RepID=A0A0T5VX87_9SPHI|nr:hypothetical protein [Pedobacter ginsenosidimutans]KRT18164.1 hypothetical protein ASU31_02470 [Pedobacter ginsenosidimutans]